MVDWIDDDPFENIFEEFFGRGRQRVGKGARFIRGEDDERVIDVLDEGSEAYLIFELAGYEEEDVSINVKGKMIEISIRKKNVEGIKEYLAQKLSAGLKYARTLPDSINPKKFDYTLRNGILEVKFERKQR